MYELFEHTADLGLRVRAADLDGLFVDAARGLFATIVTPPPQGSPHERLEFQIDGESLQYLLFDWLNELLFTFDTRRLLLGGFEAHVDGVNLRGAAGGWSFDQERYRLLHEVKAITYHRLLVERREGEWLAELVLDI